MIHRFQGQENRRNLIEALQIQKVLRSSHAAAEKLADQGILAQFQPGEILIERDAPDTTVHLILAGVVEIMINGHFYTVRERGEHVGEMALIDPGQLRCATVKARELTVVCQVSEQLFISMAEDHPEMWRQLAVELAERLRQRNKLMRQKNAEPVIFIGSSTEGAGLAQGIAGQLNLPDQIRLWNENVFQPSEHTMEGLERQLDESDFAVLVLTPDDIVESRGSEQPAPRDNLLLELGLFMGRIGRKRTIFVVPKGSKLKIPSDLLGISFVPHDLTPANAATALAATSDKILAVVAQLGCRGFDASLLATIGHQSR
jgi:CRP/FNR family cyclic AMP-dependent transcriptional regulator